MIFPTIEFAAFFVVVLALSWLLMPRPRLWKPFMLAASYFFYGYTDPRFVLLLAASTLVNQSAACAIARWRRRWVLAVAIAADLGLLGWFKYYGFFALSVDRVLDDVGLGVPLPLLQVALPVGISFFTFQAMSYVIDVWRGTAAPARLIDFAVYEAFFPHLVAGPIVRAREFVPQLASPRDPRSVPAARAVFLICGGLTKKVVLADLLARRLVDPVFDTPGQHSAVEVLVAIYGYAAQIYCDFSAYSDIAIGVALLLGFRFPDNFDRPYAASSLQDFWRRWHLTLSRWLRDYLYIPLGGSRRGPRRTQINLLVTMVLGGLWHGAAWTYVLWGAAHGGGLALERAVVRARSRRRGPTRGAIPHPRASGDDGPSGEPVPVPVLAASAMADGDERSAADSGPGPAPRRGAPALARAVTVVAVPARSPAARLWAARIATFHLVCAAWVLFRSPDLSTAGEVFRRLATGGLATGLVTPTVLAATVVGLAVAAAPSRLWSQAQRGFARLALPAQVAAVAAYLVLAYSFVGQQDVAPFIYFRF